MEQVCHAIYTTWFDCPDAEVNLHDTTMHVQSLHRVHQELHVDVKSNLIEKLGNKAIDNNHNYSFLCRTITTCSK